MDQNNGIIQLAHGSGGIWTQELLDKVILPRFDNEILAQMCDSAIFESPGGTLAFTTDSFVIKPLFFPGGDIGKLAVCGTVNDLAAAGAAPLYLTLSLIMEAGLEICLLERILDSIKNAAEDAGIKIVAGDTKVVGHGECDKIFINTSGIGVVHPKAELSAARIEPGDLIIISGTVADHGIAVMAAREELGFKGELLSDCAPLNRMTQEILEEAGPRIKVMRDPTRGGLATILNELTGRSNMIEVCEDKIPVRQEVSAVCKILGLDPLYVANEGKMVLVVAADVAGAVLAVLRKDCYGKGAAIIGEVQESSRSGVYLKTGIGGKRILDTLAGSQLPRIC